MLSDLYMLMDSFFTLMYQFCIATFWLLFSAISWLYLVCLSKKKKTILILNLSTKTFMPSMLYFLLIKFCFVCQHLSIIFKL